MLISSVFFFNLYCSNEIPNHAGDQITRLGRRFLIWIFFSRWLWYEYPHLEPSRLHLSICIHSQSTTTTNRLRLWLQDVFCRYSKKHHLWILYFPEILQVQYIVTPIWTVWNQYKLISSRKSKSTISQMIFIFSAIFLCFSLISPAPNLTLIPIQPKIPSKPFENPLLFFSIFSKKAFCNQNKNQQWKNTVWKWSSKKIKACP